MRVFKKYLPLMVAKHVKTFFKGRIYIHGRGASTSSRVLLMMPLQDDIPHRQTVLEVNELISRLHGCRLRHPGLTLFPIMPAPVRA